MKKHVTINIQRFELQKKLNRRYVLPNMVWDSSHMSCTFEYLDLPLIAVWGRLGGIFIPKEIC